MKFKVGQPVTWRLDRGVVCFGNVVSADDKTVAVCNAEMILPDGNRELPRPILFISPPSDVHPVVESDK